METSSVAYVSAFRHILHVVVVLLGTIKFTGGKDTTQRHNQSRLNRNGSYMAPQRHHYQGFNCTLEEADTAIERFYALGSRQSACSPHAWLDAWRQQWPGGRHVMVDVGCNKGATTVELLSLFAPALNITKASLHDAYAPIAHQGERGHFCGACEVDHKGAPTPVAVEVEVHCFEPSDVHFTHTSFARQRLMGDRAQGTTGVRLTQGKTTATWHMYNAALGATRGVARFTAHCNDELCALQGGVRPADSGPPATASDSTLDTTAPPAPATAAAGMDGMGAEADPQARWLGQAGSENEYEVHVTTLDDFFADTLAAGMGVMQGKRRTTRPLPRTTLVKIDAEGFDPDVLAGAQKVLRHRLTDFLLFEYHGKGAWATIHLGDVVQGLEAVGYACFLDGHPHVFKLAGQCWHPRYEIRDWSNVVCARTGGAGEALLDAMSYQHALRTAQAPPSPPAASPQAREGLRDKRGAFRGAWSV